MASRSLRDKGKGCLEASTHYFVHVLDKNTGLRPIIYVFTVGN